MSSFGGTLFIERWGLTAVNNRLQRKKRKKERGAWSSGRFVAVCQKAVLTKSKSVVTRCLVILVCEL